MANPDQQSRLMSVAKAMPVANQQVASQQKAARDLQLMQAAARKQAGTSNVASAQQVGAVQAQQAGQQQVAQATQQVAQQGQVAQMGQQANVADIQQKLAGLRMGSEEQRQKDVERLGNLSESAKQEVFDSRVNFQRDEMGRTLLNERQLADFATTQAVSAEQFQNYAQSSQQAHEMRISMLETAQRRISQELQIAQAGNEQALDQAQVKQLKQAENALNERVRKAKADYANAVGTWGMAGGIIGAVVGTVATGGNPAGGMAGYQIGQGLGTAAGADQNKQEIT